MRRLFLLLFLCPLFLPSNLSAQSQPAARVSGTVSDSQGGAAAGAAVLLRAAGREQRTVTDAAGHFWFDGVPAGPATVTVVLDRFSPITMDVDAARTPLRVVLQPAPVTEDVLVRGSLDRFGRPPRPKRCCGTCRRRSPSCRKKRCTSST